MDPKEYISFHVMSRMNSSNGLIPGGLAYCLRQKHIMPCRSFSYNQKKIMSCDLSVPCSNSGAATVTNARAHGGPLNPTDGFRLGHGPKSNEATSQRGDS